MGFSWAGVPIWAKLLKRSLRESADLTTVHGQLRVSVGLISTHTSERCVDGATYHRFSECTRLFSSGRFCPSYHWKHALSSVPKALRALKELRASQTTTWKTAPSMNFIRKPLATMSTAAVPMDGRVFFATSSLRDVTETTRASKSANVCWGTEDFCYA